MDSLLGTFNINVPCFLCLAQFTVMPVDPRFISFKTSVPYSDCFAPIRFINIASLTLVCHGSFVDYLFQADHGLLFSYPLGSWDLLWKFETIRGSLMKPKWQKLASLAQEICTL